MGDYNVPNILIYKRTHNRPYMTSLPRELNFTLTSRSASLWVQSRRVETSVDRSCDCLADFPECLGSLIIISGE